MKLQPKKQLGKKGSVQKEGGHTVTEISFHLRKKTVAD